MSTQTLSSSSSVTALSPSSRRVLFIFLIVLVWAAIYVSTLFQPGLMDDADTVHAEAAREMVLHNDWVTLRINGGGLNDGSFRYLEKAPLMYWCLAASFKLFGSSEWPARLPIALGVLALLLMVYRIGRRFYGDEGGLYAALALATGFGPFIFTRILIPDMLVGLWLALGFDFFLTILEQIDAQQKPSVWLCWGIAATMALNVLTKGLIGLVFPLGAIFLFLLLTGKLRHLLKLRLISSFLVFLVIAAPWHLLAGFRNPAQGQAKGFFWFYFVNEHFLRYLNKRFPADYDTVPLYLFWGLMLLWLMPWTAFVVQAIGQVPLRLKQWRLALSKQERATLLFAVWTFVILFFFSFSSRQEYYVLPALPGLALLLGGWLARETTSLPDSAERRSGRISSMILAAIGVAACVACVILAVKSATPPANYDIAELLKKNPQDYELSFGHILDLTPQAMGAFKVPLLVTGIAFAAGTIFNWLLRRSNRIFAANMVLTLMMVGLLHEAHAGFVIFSPVLSSKVLAQAIEKQWKPGDVIEVNGDYETGSSVNFYTHHQLYILNGRCNNIWYGSTFPDAPKIFDDNASFEERWRGVHTVFLLTDEAPEADGVCPQKDKLPAYVWQGCHRAKWGGKLVLTNEPKPCPVPAPQR